MSGRQITEKVKRGERESPKSLTSFTLLGEIGSRAADLFTLHHNNGIKSKTTSVDMRLVSYRIYLPPPACVFVAFLLCATLSEPRRQKAENKQPMLSARDAGSIRISLGRRVSGVTSHRISGAHCLNPSI